MTGRVLDGGGHVRLATAALLAGPQPLAGGDLVARRALEALGAAVQGARPLLRRAQGEADLGLGGAGPARLELEAVAVVGRRLGLVGGGLGARLLEPGAQGGELGPVGLEARRQRGDRGPGAFGLGPGDPGGLAVAAELLGDGRHLRVAVVQGVERGVARLAGLLQGGAGTRELEGCALPRRRRVGDGRAGLVEGGLHLDEARRRGGAAPHEAGPEDVAGAGDGGDALLGQRDGVLVLADECDPVEHLGDGRGDLVGGGDDVDGPGRRGGQVGPGGAVDDAGGGADDEVDLAGVLLAQPAHGGGRVGGRPDGQGLRGRAEGGRDRGLVPAGDGDELGDRAEDGRGALPRGVAQGLGAILAAQRQLERLDPGLGRSPVALGGPLGLLPAGDLGLGRVLGGARPLEGLVETGLAALGIGDRGLELAEGLLGLGGTLLGAGDHPFEPADLGLGGLDLALTGTDLAGEPGQPLAAVGGSAHEPLDAVLLGAVGGLRGLAGGGGVGEPLGDLVDLGAQGVLVGPGLGGLAAQLLGVAPARALVLVVLAEQAHPLGGHGGRGLEPVADRAQPDEAARGVGEQRGGLGGKRLLLPDLGACGRERLLERGPAAQHRRLVGDLLLQGRGHLHEVVGDEAQPGVAGVGLDDGGLAGGLGLPAERSELAADLGCEVGHPGEVDLHRLELAQRPLLALAVLEDPGGLLDEAAALLRGRPQHRVELALADDDVHLAPDAGVGEQLLDVEEPARGAVDGVLRAAPAEHRAADRHLGVVDRQRAVGVVDGHRDLGAAERRPAGRAGEDDVLHLAAAQALRALLAHDPGEGVDDVGLARAVRPDDARDARLETEVGGGGERLEALEGQALDVHVTLAIGWAGGHGRGGRRPSPYRGEGGTPGSFARDSARVGLLRRGDRGTLGDRLVVADDLGDDEVEELLGEVRVEPGVVGQGAQALDLTLLATRVGGGQTELGLEHPDPLRGLEALREQVDQRRVDVVDALAQAVQLGRGLAHAQHRRRSPRSPANPSHSPGSGLPLDEAGAVPLRRGVLAHDGLDPARAAGRARRLAQEGLEPVELLGLSLGDDLDPPVVHVAGVTDEAELEGARPGPPPEAHPLDPAADEEGRSGAHAEDASAAGGLGAPTVRLPRVVPGSP